MAPVGEDACPSPSAASSPLYPFPPTPQALTALLFLVISPKQHPGCHGDSLKSPLLSVTRFAAKKRPCKFIYMYF